MDNFLYLKKFSKKKLAIYILLASLPCTSTFVFSEEVFNSTFFDNEDSSNSVSDFSKFNKQNYQLPGVYRVDIIVNRSLIKSQDVNFIEKFDEKDNSYLFPCISLQELQNFGINISNALDPEDDRCVDFTTRIPDSSSDFQFNEQRLVLNFPQAYTQRKSSDVVPTEQWENGINAFFSNYMISANRMSTNDNKSLFLGFESGFNLGSWQFRNNSTFNYNSSRSQSNHQWNNINNYVRKNIIPLKSLLIVGDSYTEGSIFDSISFRGASLATADDMYANSEQGYAPTVRGIARTNATVIIKQNGYTVHKIAVSPGPFVIDNLSSTSVSGDLNVEVQESDGTTQKFIIPYSTLPILQREGRTKYYVAAGKNRNNLNNTKSAKFLQASAVHGLPYRLSIYTGTQLSSDYQNALIGVGQNLGTFGAMSFDITHATTKMDDITTETGQSLRFLYAKSLIRTGTTFRLLGYRYSTKDFYSFNESMGLNPWRLDSESNKLENGYFDSFNYAKKGQFEANISHGFANNYGSLYFSGSQQSYWGTSEKDQRLQASYSNSYKDLGYSLTISSIKYGLYNTEDTQYSASFSFPLEALFRNGKYRDGVLSRINLSTSIDSSDTQDTSFRSSMYGTALQDNSLQYSLSHSKSGNSDSAALSLSYLARYGYVGVGYSVSGSENQLSLSARGSALIHRNGITLGQYLSGTGILVEIPQSPNIMIDNMQGIKTDWRGYALIPYAAAYRQNRISLNTNSFADDLEIENSVASTVPTNGSITKVSFKPKTGIRTLISLTHNSKPIPFASTVTEENSKITSMIDNNGDVFLSGLPLKGRLNVVWGKEANSQCYADYDFSGHDKSTIYLLDAECK